jgi:type VI secretion system protein ImpK
VSEALTSGGPSLAPAALPLLDLASRLKGLAVAPDLDALRASVAEELQRFERQAGERGVPPDRARVLHYVLCATIDDVILAAPWGAFSVWARHGMVWTFHRDVTSGDRFFDILSKVQGDPGPNRDFLLIMYYCLAAGFEGRLRIHPDRVTELARVREELYRTLRREALAELSPQWRGVAPAARGPLTPTWLAATVGGLAAIALIGLFFALHSAIDRRAGAIIEAFASAPPQPPASLRIRTLTVTERIARFLALEIEAGLVAVSDIDIGTLVRIRNQGVFASGSAGVDPRFTALIDKIALAVAREKDQLRIIGYSDNQPISTPRFPSNVELSQARAQAVADAIGQRLDPSLIHAEGRGAADPIDTNDTDKGREANRRTEIQVIWTQRASKP